MKYFCAFVLLILAACQTDETLSAYGGDQTQWALSALDGAPFSARATIEFPSEGEVRGHGACNAFGAIQSAPYPWVEIKALRATRAACPDLALEQAYFTALTEMSLAEISGSVMILSNDAGREMVFTAQPRG